MRSEYTDVTSYEYIARIIEKYLDHKRSSIMPRLIDPNLDPPSDKTWIDCLKLRKLVTILYRYPDCHSLLHAYITAYIRSISDESMDEEMSIRETELGMEYNNMACAIGSDFYHVPFMKAHEYATYIKEAVVYDIMAPDHAVAQVPSNILQFPE